MGKGYLLDTNTIIDFSAGRLPATSHKEIAGIIDETPYISIINKIELLGFTTVPAAIKLFAENAFVFGLNDDVVDQTVLLRKQHRIKLPDAIIAATALVYDLILLSRNLHDFNKIPDLQVIDPHTM